MFDWDDEEDLDQQIVATDVDGMPAPGVLGTIRADYKARKRKRQKGPVPEPEHIREAIEGANR